LNFGGGVNKAFKTTLNVLSKMFYLLRGEKLRRTNEKPSYSKTKTVLCYGQSSRGGV